MPADRQTLLLLPLAVFLLAGCKEKPPSISGGSGTIEKQNSGDEYFASAMNYLDRLPDLPPQAASQVSYDLTRWIEKQPENDDWQPDPMIARLPPEVRKIEPLEELGDHGFKQSDFEFLQQARWMRDVANWASRSKPPRELSAWAAERWGSTRQPGARQLLTAERLFDWTVRNIQLLQLVDYPKRQAGPTVPGQSVETPLTPPELAVVGPGYTLQPWQSIYFGVGDSWQRARVFIQLCRQQGLVAVMLAVNRLDVLPNPRPWLPAVWIDGELFLFDTQLGLPIPGENDTGIATLSDVQDNPALLTDLDIDDHKYPVRPEHVGQIKALIDASPGFLTRRMKLVQNELTGARQLVLSVSPTAIKESLSSASGLQAVTLWVVPFEAWQYHSAYRQRLREDQRAAAVHYQTWEIMESAGPIVEGRKLHLEGLFENRDDRPGAKARYMSARVANATLSALPSDPDVQQQLGVPQQPGESDEMWLQRKKQATYFYTLGKIHASYWLALIHFDTGRYEQAIQWLEKRTLAAYPNGQWTGSARYNLARSYEASGQIERARELYLLDESPQAHGNLLRARRLAASQRGK